MLTFTHLEHIHAAHCAPLEHHLFLLADHSGLPELSRKLRERGIRWTNLFGDDRRPALTAASPLLFDVAFTNGRLEQRRLLEWLQDVGQYSSTLMLIASPLALHDLARALSKRCDGVLSEGEAIVVRYFDTRVFPQLLEVMSEEDRRTWLGIASGWWFMDRDAATVHIPSKFQAQDNYQAPMTLSDEQMSRMLQASEVDEVAYLLKDNLPEKFQRMHSGERYRLIRDKLDTAKALGLSSLGDRALYCGLAFLHGADFDAQTPWQHALSRVKAKEISLTDAVNQVSEELLDKLNRKQPEVNQ